MEASVALSANHHVVPSLTPGAVSVFGGFGRDGGVSDATTGSLHGLHGRICVCAAPLRHADQCEGMRTGLRSRLENEDVCRKVTETTYRGTPGGHSSLSGLAPGFLNRFPTRFHSS